MKASDKFKSVIEEYLTNAAQGDTAFAQHYAKASKNLESCFDYIGGEVKKTGLCAFHDQEIFDMAVRYYIDDTIAQPVPVNCTVAVSQSAAPDLFSVAPAPGETAEVPKAAATVPAAKPAPKTLTLFDL
jgi:predicted protein tyrosine phosphatase